MDTAEPIEAECTWDVAAWRKGVRWAWVMTLVWIVVAGVIVAVAWWYWLAWVIAAVLVLRRVALLWFLITRGRDLPVRLISRPSGLHLETTRGQRDYSWDEARGFRGSLLKGGPRPIAPRYTTGGAATSATLVLPDRQVNLGGCSADQRERLVQVLDRHLAARQQATRREGA